MKILVHTANANDACSFYRGVGPWSHLVKNRPHDFDVTYGTDFCWGDIRSADILFLLRPTLPTALPLIACAKDWGTKVWVDWDDDPFSVPLDNPSHELFARPSTVNTIQSAMESADLLTVSTQFLKERLGNKNQNIAVVPNAFDEDLMRWTNPARGIASPDQYVLWRGSRTHDRDLDSVSTELVEIANEFSDWTFIFFGCDPMSYRISEKMPKVIRLKSEGRTVDYFKIISAMRPRIMIAPLADTVFNRSKSCIASLEASFAGAACVGPSFSEWDVPGCVQYSENGGGLFQSELRTLMLVGEACAANAQRGFEYIMGERSLKAINMLRMAHALELTNSYEYE